eukprot:403346309
MIRRLDGTIDLPNPYEPGQSYSIGNLGYDQQQQTRNLTSYSNRVPYTSSYDQVNRQNNSSLGYNYTNQTPIVTNIGPHFSANSAISMTEVKDMINLAMNDQRAYLDYRLEQIEKRIDKVFDHYIVVAKRLFELDDAIQMRLRM